MAHILIVCTANICRSPVAEGLLKHRLSREGLEGWVVSSAGTWALEPRRASRYSIDVLMEMEGIDIKGHRAKMVDSAQIEAADLILCMEKGHVEALNIEFPQASDRTFLLSEMADGRRFNVNDPYGTPKVNYEEMVEGVRNLIDRGLPRIISLAQGQDK